MAKVYDQNPKLTIANSGVKKKELDLKPDAKVAAVAKATPAPSGSNSTMIKSGSGMTTTDLLKMASSDVPATADTHRSSTAGSDLSMWKDATSTVPVYADTHKAGKGG